MKRFYPIGRFQVMATLQAARAYLLGLPLVSAKSWGLNRAIFYAAAKRGFVKEKPQLIKEVKVRGIKVEEKELENIRKTFKIYLLGDEQAYSVEVEDKVMFVIGGQIQDEESFAKQIEARFGKELFDKCFNEAVEICKSYDEGVLKSQRYFFESIYKPRRDELASKWSELVKGE